ncbi:MAG: flagellar basal-body MS-ring/collar protein FliF [Hyphomicrobiaceae bacterium]
MLDQFRSGLISLGAKRLILLGATGLTVLASIIGSAYFVWQPEHTTLYVGLESREASRIGAALSEAGIPFSVNAEGTKVEVARAEINRARMILAEKGLPGSANAGYELFDNLGSMGLTSFMQEITRSRALEGEIVRTLQSMRGIRAARVHLVLPDRNSFRRLRTEPTASVVLRAAPGSEMPSPEAIRHLVSAAVAGLSVNNVSVLSTDGRVLASGGSSESMLTGKQIDMEKNFANQLKEKIQQTLAPYLGLGNFRVSVLARLNVDEQQSKETKFDPENKVERSIRTIKDTGSSQDVGNNSGVGVESNIPEQEGESSTENVSKKNSVRKEEVRNFEVNSKVVSISRKGYRVDRLSVAVVVNKKQLVKTLGANPSDKDVDGRLLELKKIVQAASGVEDDRGDELSVNAVNFLGDNVDSAEISGPSFLEQAMQHTGSVVKSIALVLFAFLVVWFGLRPISNSIAEIPVAQLQAQELSTSEMPQVVEGAQTEGVLSDQTGKPPISYQDNKTVAAPLDEQQLASDHSKILPSPKVDQEDPFNGIVSELTDGLRHEPANRLAKIIAVDQQRAADVLKQWMTKEEV